MSTWPHRSPLAVVIWLAVAGCGGSPAAPTSPGSSTPARDSVNGLTNMNPAPGTPLQAGQTVTLAGTAAYTLATADLGAMVMVVQDQTDRILQPDTQSTVVVHRGTADVTLTQTIAVPSAGATSVRVFFALTAAGATTTTAVLSVSYPVR